MPLDKANITGILNNNLQEIYIQNINLQSGEFKIAGSVGLKNTEQIKTIQVI